jgi:hypothetical protein
MLAVWLMWVR